MPRFLDAINMEHNEIKNARIHVLDGAPSNPVEGQVYYNGLTNTPYIYDGGGWLAMTGTSYRGAYSNGVVYARNDFVTYNGSTYIVTDPTGGAGVLPTDDAMWDLLSAGGVSTYTNATAMPVAVGGLAAGQTFNNMSLTEVLNRLLYPYQNPGFSTFSMSAGSPGATVEVGYSLTGSKTFTWASTNAANVTPGSVIIQQDGATIASGLNASGSTTVTINTVARTSPGSSTFTVRGTNTNGVQFSTSFSISWQYRKFYGTSSSTTLTENEIEALTNAGLSAATSGNYAFAAGGYKYIAIPSSFSAITSVKDQSTLLSVTMAGTTEGYTEGTTDAPFKTVSVTNANGVTSNYRLYRSRYELGGAITFVVA